MGSTNGMTTNAVRAGEGRPAGRGPGGPAPGGPFRGAWRPSAWPASSWARSSSSYNACKIEVGTGEQAVLIRKVGLDLERDMELAPPPKDGKRTTRACRPRPNDGVLTEGRYFYNPFYWDWEIGDQFVVPDGKIGVRIALERRRPARRARSWPSRARRGSSARSSSPGDIPTTRTPRRSSCTTR